MVITPNKYTREEIKNLLDDESKLSVMEVPEGRYIVSKDDIVDIIGDYGWNHGMPDMSFYDFENDTLICNTMGMFLDKCDPTFRRENLDRLIQLQTGEIEPKPYKICSTYDFYDVKESIQERRSMDMYFREVMKQERSEQPKETVKKSPKMKI